jgi:hypothetical protein
VVLALVLLQTAVATATPQVGVILAVDDPGARLVLRESLEKQLGPETRWSCRETPVCLEVVAVPIATGKTTTGWAVAARFSRRLKLSPQWPGGAEKEEAKPQAPAVDIIEDTTASGEVACVPCEEAEAQCQRQLGELKDFTRERFEDIGGLFLRVGPAQDQFLRQTALDLAGQLAKELAEGGTP